jgi:hypothetical protein
MFTDEELRRSLGHRAAGRTPTYTHDATVVGDVELCDSPCSDLSRVTAPVTAAAAEVAAGRS